MISLLESFLEHQQYQTTKALQSTIKMTVEDLEDLFEGFSTAFDESEDIEIVTTLLKTNNITIDDTFNNIAFRLNLRHEFKNPIEPKYLAAQVTTSIQGVLSLEMNEKMEIKFNSDIKQHRLTDYKPFFKTESSDKEVAMAFRQLLASKIHQSIQNQLVSKTLSLPYSASHQSSAAWITKFEAVMKPQMVQFISSSSIQPTKKKAIILKFESFNAMKNEYPVLVTRTKADLQEIQKAEDSSRLNEL